MGFIVLLSHTQIPILRSYSLFPSVVLTKACKIYQD